MKRSRVFAHAAFVTTLCTTLFAVATASGQVSGSHLLTPNGNPTGPAMAYSPYYFPGYYYEIGLNPGYIGTGFLLPPAPDGFQSYSLQQILNNCLTAQNSAWSVTGSFDIQGQLRIETYEAWTEATPALNQGTLPYVPPRAANGSGGTALGLHYLPTGPDPTSPHWLQLVHTNMHDGSIPSWRLPYDPPGWVWFIDNPGLASPFYDVIGGAANATDFFDASARPYDSTTRWRGYLYLATGNEQSHTISTCDAAFWDFDDPLDTIPEPSSALFLTIAGLVSWRTVVRKRGRVSTAAAQTEFRTIEFGVR